MKEAYILKWSQAPPTLISQEDKKLKRRLKERELYGFERGRREEWRLEREERRKKRDRRENN